MIDEKTKNDAERRLKLIRGQLDGIHRMVEQEKYCIDIINQITAARNALEKVSLLVMKRHIESCVAESIKVGDVTKKEQKIDELMATLYKFVT